MGRGKPSSLAQQQPSLEHRPELAENINHTRWSNAMLCYIHQSSRLSLSLSLYIYTVYISSAHCPGPRVRNPSHRRPPPHLFCSRPPSKYVEGLGGGRSLCIYIYIYVSIFLYSRCAVLAVALAMASMGWSTVIYSGGSALSVRGHKKPGQPHSPP